MKKTGKFVTLLSLGIRHNPELLKAVQLLEEAKNHLWYAEGDFGGRRSRAIQHVNEAVDEIREMEEKGYPHR